MSINQDTLNSNNWKNVSYEDKTGELLTISNNMNWSFEQRAEAMKVSEERLEKIVAMEEVDEDKVNNSLDELLPVLNRRLQEHKRDVERKKSLNE